MTTTVETLATRLHASLCPDKLEKEIVDKLTSLESEVFSLNKTIEQKALSLDELTSFFAMAKEAVVSVVEDGWLMCGSEGLSEAQEKLYALYKATDLPNVDVSKVIKVPKGYTVIVLPSVLEPGNYKIAPVIPPVEFVDKYLKANEQYWIRTDSKPKSNPSVWRNGTPREATAEGYTAMLETAVSFIIPPKEVSL
jgi:hypothetical protein